MNRPNPSWYFGLLALALTTAGVRALTWSRPAAHDLEPAEVVAGQALFTHEWKPNDPLSPSGDGLGPVFNAASCVACHGQGGIGGGGDSRHNVTMFSFRPDRSGITPQQGVVHAKATSAKYQETLTSVHVGLPSISQPKLVKFDNRGQRSPTFGFEFATPREIVLSQRNTPALFGAKWIDELPDRVILAQEKKQRLEHGWSAAQAEDRPIGRALRLADGRVGRFGWKAQSASLFDFVQAACANELGLGNPGAAQPKPLGAPDYKTPGLDLTTEQCRQMTTFIAALARPIEQLPLDPGLCGDAEIGRSLFRKVGCADCHAPNLGSIEGIYSDLLLHRMGPDLTGGGFYYGEPAPNTTPSGPTPVQGPLADEWRTPPLWGVADSAPYLHDGRAATLEEAIALHAGQAARAAREFSRLGLADQGRLIAFLKTLRAPQ